MPAGIPMARHAIDYRRTLQGELEYRVLATGEWRPWRSRSADHGFRPTPTMGVAEAHAGRQRRLGLLD